MPDQLELIRSSSWTVIGQLAVKSNLLVVSDPFLVSEARAFLRPVPPGNYDVRLLRRQTGEAGVRNAAASVVFLADTPVRIEPASVKGNTNNFHLVDAGLSSVMDDESASALSAQIDTFFEANPNGNFYDDVLGPEFACSATASERDDGDWAMHELPGGSAVALFASGMGDGLYGSYWALNSSGQLVALLIDFEIS